MIRWNYQLTKQKWLVSELRTVVPFNWFGFQKFAFAPEKLPELSSNGPQSPGNLTGPKSNIQIEI